MKKVFVSIIVLFIAAAGYSQHLSVNAFGGYTFRDKVDFGNAYTYINAGGIWGVSVEGVNAHGSAIELLYQYQSTDIPSYKYPSNVQFPGATGAVVSYLLLNFEQYYMANEKVQPYGGIGLGAAFYKGDVGSSETKFAWDLKAGVKFKASQTVGIKVGAQLLGSSQATGTAFYYGYVYSTYSTILQFSFTGGLVFDLGGKH